MKSSFKISLVIILVIIIDVIALILANGVFEQQSINKIANEGTKRLENFLREYQNGDSILGKYNLSFNGPPEKEYTKINYQLMGAKNIGESEMTIRVVHKVTLHYRDGTNLNYEVRQTFTTFIAGKVRLTKKDIRDGVWAMDWDSIE